MKKAVLSLGTNLGDREGFLRNAVKSINEREDTRVTALSKVYETDPWGGVEQPDYLNICVEIETSLTPEELLSAMQKIETEAHRTREIRWGARTLDIDIIIYEGETRETEVLLLPHPRFKERAFVLRPLADIYPDLNALGEDFPHYSHCGDPLEVRETDIYL